jgi:hypothetical protein
MHTFQCMPRSSGCFNAYQGKKIRILLQRLFNGGYPVGLFRMPCAQVVSSTVRMGDERGGQS